MATQLNNKHEIRPRLGSFWYDQMDTEQAKGITAMQHLVDHSRAQNQLQASGDWALNAEYARENDITLHYDPRDVVKVGSMWEITLSDDIYASAVMTADGRTMLRGIGFDANNTTISFHDHPDTLFKNNSILLVSAEVGRRNLLSYTMQLDDIKGPVDYVRDYYRGSQSPLKFERALAQAAGLKITPQDGFLLRATTTDEGICYEFDYGSICVSYAHDFLLAHTYYYAHTIIGDQVKVFASNISDGASAADGYDLYDNLVDWSDGLLLDSICPIKEVTVPFGDVGFTTVVSGSSVHLKFDASDTAQPNNLLTPTTAVDDKFHGWLWNSEKRSGLYLNSLLPAPFSTAGQTGSVNLLQLMFQHLLGRRGLVIDLRTESIGEEYHNRALKFIYREKPMGVIPIVRGFAANYPDPSNTEFVSAGYGWQDSGQWIDTSNWID